MKPMELISQFCVSQVINSYLDMIAARNKSKPNNWPSVYVFTTFFYPKYLNEGYSNILKRWTRKVTSILHSVRIYFVLFAVQAFTVFCAVGGHILL